MAIIKKRFCAKCKKIISVEERSYTIYFKETPSVYFGDDDTYSTTLEAEVCKECFLPICLSIFTDEEMRDCWTL